MLSLFSGVESFTLCIYLFKQGISCMVLGPTSEQKYWVLVAAIRFNICDSFLGFFGSLWDQWPYAHTCLQSIYDNHHLSLFYQKKVSHMEHDSKSRKRQKRIEIFLVWKSTWWTLSWCHTPCLCKYEKESAMPGHFNN